MGPVKEHNHPMDPAYEEFARVFQALANPKRLHVLRCLSESEKSVGEVLACKAFTDVPQSTVSQHLAALRQQGLVKARKEGTSVYYRLSNPRIADLIRLVGDLVEQRVTEMQAVAETI